MIVEPRRNDLSDRMSERRRCGESKCDIRSTASGRSTAFRGRERAMVQPGLYLFEERTVRGPLRIPRPHGRMHRAGRAQPLEFRPKRIVNGMREIVAFEKHRPNERRAKARNLCGAPKLLDGKVDVLQRNHRRGEQPVRRGFAEIRDPVVVGARKRIGDVGILYQVEALGEPRRIEQRLIDAHRIHVAQARLGIRCARGRCVSSVSVELADLVPRHPRPPDRVARDVGVHRVAEDLAVDLEVGAELALFTPQREFSQSAELRIEVLAP